jgi:CubicO group peptidase (beta-lactamase class C family)
MIRAMLVGVLVCSPICRATDTRSELQDYFAKACQAKMFMGTASLSLNGKTIFSQACGWADAEWNVTNTTETKFRTGSIAKQFTAASVLLLHEEGKLSLSDPIGKYLPDLPESWKSATIHQLLTHTSGIPIPDYSDSTVEKRFPLGPTPADMLGLLRDKPLNYPHGTKLAYNNMGYFLLGFLVEKLSGMKYEQFVQERLFDRLEMRDSGFDDIHKIIARRARGYVLVGGELQNVDPLDAGASAWSAGAFYSTTHDFIVWSEALAHEKLLNADSTAQMFALYPETELKGMHYGYGVVLTSRFGHRLQYHGGGIKGFTTVLQRYPDVGLVVVVLSNLDGDSSSPTPIESWDLGDALAKIWFQSDSK